MEPESKSKKIIRITKNILSIVFGLLIILLMITNVLTINELDNVKDNINVLNKKLSSPSPQSDILTRANGLPIDYQIIYIKNENVVILDLVTKKIFDIEGNELNESLDGDIIDKNGNIIIPNDDDDIPDLSSLNDLNKRDTDGDGIPDAIDEDDDGDGVPDVEDDDDDGDGIPDEEDEDDDGNGIPDSDEQDDSDEDDINEVESENDSDDDDEDIEADDDKDEEDKDEEDGDEEDKDEDDDQTPNDNGNDEVIGDIGEEIDVIEDKAEVLDSIDVNKLNEVVTEYTIQLQDSNVSISSIVLEDINEPVETVKDNVDNSEYSATIFITVEYVNANGQAKALDSFMFTTIKDGEIILDPDSALSGMIAQIDIDNRNIRANYKMTAIQDLSTGKYIIEVEYDNKVDRYKFDINGNIIKVSID